MKANVRRANTSHAYWNEIASPRGILQSQVRRNVIHKSSRGSLRIKGYDGTEYRPEEIEKA